MNKQYSRSVQTKMMTQKLFVRVPFKFVEALTLNLKTAQIVSRQKMWVLRKNHATFQCSSFNAYKKGGQTLLTRRHVRRKRRKNFKDFGHDRVTDCLSASCSTSLVFGSLPDFQLTQVAYSRLTRSLHNKNRQTLSYRAIVVVGSLSENEGRRRQGTR